MLELFSYTCTNLWNLDLILIINWNVWNAKLFEIGHVRHRYMYCKCTWIQINWVYNINNCTWQAVDSVKEPSDHKVIDLFILLILYSTDRKKPVESLIRNKIRSGAFTEVLLQEAFRERAQVLVYFCCNLLKQTCIFLLNKIMFIPRELRWALEGIYALSITVLGSVWLSFENEYFDTLKTLICYWIINLEVFNIYM